MFTDGYCFFIGNVIIPGARSDGVLFNDAGSATATAGFVFNKTSNAVTVTGNIGANYYTGNGSLLTGIVANSVGVLANLSVTGNVVGGNISTAGVVTATGNVTGGNVVTAGAVSAASVSTSGNITGANINGNGSGLSSITGANVTGTVANAAHATVADSANAVAGGNVSGQVANASDGNPCVLTSAQLRALALDVVPQSP